MRAKRLERGRHGAEIQVALTTEPARAVGLDVELPAGARLDWRWQLEGRPWPAEGVFVGPLGFARPEAARGVDDVETLALAAGSRPPFVAPDEELGLFVVIERGELAASAVEGPAGAAAETMKLLQDWGYAAKPAPP